MKTKKVAIVHTSLVSVKHLIKLFKKDLPEVDLINIVDDSLLAEVIENGYSTEGVFRRMKSYFEAAASMDVDIIFNQCSSVGEVADKAAKEVNVPVLKIDEAMAEEAIRLGERIAVVATVASTMGPSVRLIKRKAEESDKNVEIVECLVDGALNLLMQEGNRKEHNRLVKEKILSVQDDVDVIVLSQGSMVVLLPELDLINKPVLTSPKLGVMKLRMILDLPGKVNEEEQ